ncbi:putative reverse transcriptase domain-containing protein [Tanacetum coccineum]
MSRYGHVTSQPYWPKARYEDERTTTTIAKPNDLNTGMQVQYLEKTTFDEANKVEETNLTSPDMVVAEDLGQKHIQNFDETAMLLMTHKDDDPSEVNTDEGGEFDDRLDEITLDLSREFVIRVLESKDVSGGSLVGFLKWVYREKNCEVFSVTSRWESCGSGRRKVVEKTAEDGRTSGNDRGITIWDLGIKSASQDNTLREREDGIRWKDSNGNMLVFSVKHAWEALRPRSMEVSWYRIVWFSHCIRRNAFTIWLIMRRCLKTHDKMRPWDVFFESMAPHLAISAGNGHVGIPVLEDITPVLLLSNKANFLIVYVVDRIVTACGMLPSCFGKFQAMS